ncbi:Mitomycin resistance protein mcrB [Gemmatimonas aurantiaca]|nr:Mitomycin resistance protein mcrB [Gemmatimonas aurantiaca]
MAKFSKTSKTESLKDLRKIPGVGESISQYLLDLGIRRVSDLSGRDPEKLYAKSCHLAGHKIDRCLLYVYRCAVYFASTKRPKPDKLKWWNWKDAETDKKVRKARKVTK